MEDKVNFMEPLFEKAKEYGKTSYELFKLKTLNKTVKVLSTYLSRGIAFLFFSMFLVFLNIGIALWLGDLLGKTSNGFLCVAGFYGIIWGVLYFFMHNWLKKKISNKMITHLLN